jgi:eukaryotic-like serine/threonine-protein kinase
MSFTYALKLGRKVGEGFFGDVHEGIDNVHGKVAVKVLRPLPRENPTEWALRKETLLAEAQNLKAAEHENVVRVHALVRADADDRLHMVAEFCDDGSLQAEYEQAPMLLSNVKSVLTDVCRGLECIHARGMVHRDVKPGNILRSKKRFKVGDFGLVSNSLIFGYASAAGYSDHLAPEVHQDDLTSAQSDVWALGMTIYRLLHGHPFYQAHFTGIDIPESIKNGRFASCLPWLPHIPNAWRKFIRKAMHDDTAQRFKTGFAMCQAGASLSIEPGWECDYTPKKAHWKRKKGNRQIEVTREVLSPRKHLWSAISVGGRRSRWLDGVKTPVSGSQATEELEAFFATST